MGGAAGPQQTLTWGTGPGSHPPTPSLGELGTLLSLHMSHSNSGHISWSSPAVGCGPLQSSSPTPRATVLGQQPGPNCTLVSSPEAQAAAASLLETS